MDKEIAPPCVRENKEKLILNRAEDLPGSVATTFNKDIKNKRGSKHNRDGEWEHQKDIRGDIKM